MPIYDYKCKNEHVFDEMCSMSERTVKKDCPDCNEKGSWVMAVHTTQPHFGNRDTLFNMRERKRTIQKDFNGHI